VEHYGLVNLIAGERLVMELMQSNLTGKKVSEELLALLDKERNQAMRKQLQEATLKLGTGDASRRTAAAILKKVREWR
ncbi:MAG: lipid-A-disaccharide synthase, partial [Pyrinomonadaceae bacterium]